jgi:hypothetical protein
LRSEEELGIGGDDDSSTFGFTSSRSSKKAKIDNAAAPIMRAIQSQTAVVRNLSTQVSHLNGVRASESTKEDLLTSNKRSHLDIILATPQVDSTTKVLHSW